MTVCFSAYSQDTSRITITSDQLKTANLIFAEHEKYSKIIPLLKQENENLHLINQSWLITDSIKTVQLNNQNQIMIQQTNAIQQLEKNLKTSRTIGGTAIGISIGVTVLCLLLK